jgi:hypothetical protein
VILFLGFPDAPLRLYDTPRRCAFIGHRAVAKICVAEDGTSMPPIRGRPLPAGNAPLLHSLAAVTCELSLPLHPFT